MRNQPIERIMTTPAVVITPAATLNEACDLMARENLHHLPVVEDGRLIGIVSATDLIARSGGNEPDVGRIRITEVMHRDPISLSRKATLDDAAVLALCPIGGGPQAYEGDARHDHEEDGSRRDDGGPRRILPVHLVLLGHREQVGHRPVKRPARLHLF